MSKQKSHTRAASPGGPPLVAMPFEPSNVQAVAILTLLVSVFFHKIILGQAFFWEDFIYQNYPFRNFAATSLAAGELPLWNPYTFNGMPFLADIQTTVLYIPCLLLTMFVSSGSLSYYWLELVIIAHFLLAGVGMFFLAQDFSIRRLPALFAAVTYMLSGYMIVHAIHQQNLTLVAWYPLVLLFFRRALREQRWRYVFLCGLVLGHSILAGYPQLSLFLYFFLGLYFLLELLTAHKGGALLSRPARIMSAKAASVVVISIGLAMIQLLPTFELSDLSQRASITYQKASEGSLAWSQLATLIFPKMFGTAGAGGYEYFGPGTYFYYWETCIYLGVLPLLLAVLSIRLRRNTYVAFFLSISLFSILFALGSNFYFFRLFYEFVPGFSTFRIPARMGILLTFSVSLLSAFAFQSLLYEQKSEKEKKSLRNVVVMAGVAAVVLLVMILSGSFTGSLEPAHYAQVAPLVKSTSTVSLLLFAVGCAATLLILRGPRTRFAPLLFVAVLFADMYWFGGNQNNGHMNPAEYFKRRSDLVTFLKAEGEKELFRVNTRNAHGMLPGWDRNQGMIDRIFMMEGYTPLALQRAYAPMGSAEQSFDLLNVRYKTVFNEQTGQQEFVEHPTRMPRAFLVYRIQVARNDEELLALLKSPAFNHRTAAILEEEPAEPLEAPAGEPVWDARIVSYRNNAITVDVQTSHDGLLVLSEIYYPGWNAYVDGVATEILRTNYNLRGLLVKAGRHTIDVRFEPASFTTGAWISAVTMLLCATGIVVSSRKNTGSGQG